MDINGLYLNFYSILKQPNLPDFRDMSSTIQFLFFIFVSRNSYFISLLQCSTIILFHGYAKYYPLGSIGFILQDSHNFRLYLVSIFLNG